MRRFCLILLLFVMITSAALAETPDLALLTYQAPETRGDAESLVDAASARIIPVDLWLDGTPNMGGVNLIDGSIYPQGSADSTCTGGFHYLKGNQAGGSELHGWYLDILSALPGLLGDKQSSWRVLRYGDEAWSEAALRASGWEGAVTSSVKRDLMTYAIAADAQVFRDMVTPSAAEGFYGVGVAALNRISALPSLENEDQREALARAQTSVLAGASQGDKTMLLDRENGQSHLLQALSCLDTSRLNVLTLDTWSLGDPTVAEGDALIDPYRRLLEKQGYFSTQGLSATFFALRLDYIGSVTSYASLSPAEALHWGHLSQNQDTKRYFECAMPRCVLMLLLGRQDEVTRMADALEQFLKTDATLNDPEGRGYHRGDGAVTQVNYVYGGQKYERSSFTFAYVRSDLTRREVATVTEQDPSCTVALNGSAVTPSAGTIHPLADGSYADMTLTVSVPMSAEAVKLGLDPEAIAQSARLTTVDSLMMTDVKDNTPDTLNAYLSRGDVQVIPCRDKLYVFENRAPENMSMALSVDAGVMTFTVTFPGSSLTPGYLTLNMTARADDASLAQPALFSWLVDSGEAGAADAGLWNYETGDRMPTEWLTMPSVIAATDGQTRKTLQGSLRHAWCVGSQSETLGRTPNIPPIFRLLNAQRLTQAFQWAAISGEKQLADCTVTLFVDNK